MLKRFWMLTILALMVPLSVWAQGPAPCPCLSNQPINPNDVITMEGKADLSSFLPGRGSPVLTLVTSDGQKTPVQIAPFWYLRNQKFALANGQSLTVKMFQLAAGQTTRNVALALVAADGKEIKLRDSNGCPLWAGSRGRGLRWQTTQ